MKAESSPLHAVPTVLHFGDDVALLMLVKFALFCQLSSVMMVLMVLEVQFSTLQILTYYFTLSWKKSEDCRQTPEVASNFAETTADSFNIRLLEAHQTSFPGHPLNFNFLKLNLLKVHTLFKPLESQRGWAVVTYSTCQPNCAVNLPCLCFRGREVQSGPQS